MKSSTSSKKLSKNIRITRTVVYFMTFGGPILLMMNCSGWDTGSGVVESCILDTSFFRSVAELLYTVVFFSAFALLLPILLYMAFVIGLTETAIKSFSEDIMKTTEQNKAE